MNTNSVFRHRGIRFSLNDQCKDERVAFMKMAIRLVELEMRCHGVKEQDDDMSESING